MEESKSEAHPQAETSVIAETINKMADETMKSSIVSNKLMTIDGENSIIVADKDVKAVDGNQDLGREWKVVYTCETK